MCISMHVHECAHVHVYVHVVCVYVCVCVCVCLYGCLCVYECVYVWCVYVCEILHVLIMLRTFFLRSLGKLEIFHFTFFAKKNYFLIYSISLHVNSSYDMHNLYCFQYRKNAKFLLNSRK